MADWTDTLAAIAPGLASAFGGPVAGLAVTAIEKVFGIEPGSGTPETFTAALNGATPEQLLALKKADQDFALNMKKLNIDLEASDAKDRDSARTRAAAQRDWSPQVIGFALIAIWGFINYKILSGAFHPTIAPEMVGRILGYIDTATLMFLTYLYGTTRTSQAKDDTIKNLSK